MGIESLLPPPKGDVCSFVKKELEEVLHFVDARRSRAKSSFPRSPNPAQQRHASVRSAGEVEETRVRTEHALAQVLANKSGGQRLLQGEQLVNYTPAKRIGEDAPKVRTLRIVEEQYDPLEPPRHSFTKSVAFSEPTGPPEPILSKPKPATAEERKEWAIPRSVSNWKNPSGKILDLDQRVANVPKREPQLGLERRTALMDALYEAEDTSRNELALRAAQKQKEQEAKAKEREQELRALAISARRQGTRDSEPREVTEAVALGHKRQLQGDDQFDQRLFMKRRADEPLFGAQHKRGVYQAPSDKRVEFE